MRERIARAASAAAVGTLVVLAFVFAGAQNPPEAERAEVTAESAAPDVAPDVAPSDAPSAPPEEAAVQATLQAADSARGRALFAERGCTGCHSAGGVGSPRIPLDGVGARRTRASLRAWTVGAEALTDSLAPSTLRRKQEYGRLPTAELDALVAFLASLKRE